MKRTKEQLTIQMVVDAAGTQEKAAEWLGVTQASISRYLDGRVTPRGPVMRLAGVLLAYHVPEVTGDV